MSNTVTLTFDTSAQEITPVIASKEQRQRLASLMRLLMQAPQATAYQLISPSGAATDLPEPLCALIQQITALLARGDAIAVVPVGKAMTTQQAANLLNVSRQYLVRLLDEGHIPHHKTGTHRRVMIEDLLAFKHQRDQARMTTLDDLSQLSQDFGGYEEIPTGE